MCLVKNQHIYFPKRSVRQVKKNGGVTLIVVLMAAIGIGAFFGLHAGEKTMKTVVAIPSLWSSSDS